MEDGHQLCPSCLGIGHLREALTDPCMDCGILPLSVREARLQEVEGLLQASTSGTPAVVPAGWNAKRKRGSRGHSSRKKTATATAAVARHEMEDLRAEIERLKAMVQAPPVPPPAVQQQPAVLQPQAVQQPLAVEQPPPPPPQAAQEPEGNGEEPVLDYNDESSDDDDAMSTRASNSMFFGADDIPYGDRSPGHGAEGDLQEDSVQAEDGSETSRRSSGSTEPGRGLCSLRATLRAALAKVGLDDPSAAVGPSNPFFRRVSANAKPPFSVPPSPHYIEQLKKRWANPGASVRYDRDARTLASMDKAGEHGLVGMPPVDQCIAALVLTPDEALKKKPRCPSGQCSVTDDLLTKAYASAAMVGRLGNSLSVLLLAQSKILESGPGTELAELNDVALESFAFMSSELGRLMSTLVVARRQVWLAQAPMSDKVRKTLRDLPVVPGQLFGPEANEALQRRQQSRQASEDWGLRGRGSTAPSSRPSKPRGARDPRRLGYLNPQPQPWQYDQAAAGGWQHQPRGGQRPRPPRRGQGRGQRPPKPPNNPPGRA